MRVCIIQRLLAGVRLGELAVDSPPAENSKEPGFIAGFRIRDAILCPGVQPPLLKLNLLECVLKFTYTKSVSTPTKIRVSNIWKCCAPKDARLNLAYLYL